MALRPPTGTIAKPRHRAVGLVRRSASVWSKRDLIRYDEIAKRPRSASLPSSFKESSLPSSIPISIPVLCHCAKLPPSKPDADTGIKTDTPSPCASRYDFSTEQQVVGGEKPVAAGDPDPNHLPRRSDVADDEPSDLGHFSAYSLGLGRTFSKLQL